MTTVPAVLRTPIAGRPRPAAPPSLRRLVATELRKMLDTRSGMWLQIAIVVLTLGMVALASLTGDADDHRWRDLLSAATFPSMILLPLAGILLVSSEWSQRTSLVTFTLVPHRGRVLVAKIGAATTLAVAAFGVCLVLSAVGTLVGGADVDHVWTLPLGLVGQGLLSLTTGMAMGVAFGAALLSPAPAIVAYFALPTAISALSELAFFKHVADWIDSSRSLGPLTEQLLDVTEWGQVGTTLLLWMVLPLLIGAWRIGRAEIG